MGLKTQSQRFLFIDVSILERIEIGPSLSTAQLLMIKFEGRSCSKCWRHDVEVGQFDFEFWLRRLIEIGSEIFRARLENLQSFDFEKKPLSEFFTRSRTDSFQE